MHSQIFLDDNNKLRPLIKKKIYEYWPKKYTFYIIVKMDVVLQKMSVVKNFAGASCTVSSPTSPLLLRLSTPL